MANLFAYQFVLRPRKGQSSQECLNGVRDEIADWIGELYRGMGQEGVALPFDGTCLSPHPKHELWSNQCDGATHRLATIEWIYPEGKDPSLWWQLACTVACDDKAVETALVLGIVSRPFLLRPWQCSMDAKNPLSFLPSLVKRLLHLWSAEIGGWPVPRKFRLLRASALDRFVRETLNHPARTLPVVVANLTGPVHIKENELQGDQDRLLGLAHVVALPNASALQRWLQLVPNEPTWTNCPARVCWPHFPDERPGTFPAQFGAKFQEAVKKRPIVQVLLDELTQLNSSRFREGELIRAARLALEREQGAWRQAARNAERELTSLRAEFRQAQEERDRLRQECATARQVIRSLQEVQPQSFDELAAELERAWDDNRRLNEEIKAERQQLAELREELRIHQENWSLFAASRGGEGRAPAPVPPSERTFASVAEALQAAAEDFADVLVVWQDARRSAELSPFRTPSKVYRALEAIAEVGRSYFQSRDGGPPLGPIEQAFACRVPFKYTGFESQTTLNLYGAERVFHHENQSRQMQRHLTLGGGETNNCLQIYFDFDGAAQRVLIGYCGRHLPYHRQRT